MGKGSLTKRDWASMPSVPKLLTQLDPSANGRVDGEKKADLLTTIEERIIPHLVLAHTVTSSPNCVDTRPPPSEEEVTDFADIVAIADLTSALSFIESIAAQGLSLDMILLQLLTPAARLLGQQWIEDTRSFTEVTIGLSTLQQIVHVLGPRFATGLSNRGFVVLVSPLSEQHTLGLYLVGEFLRRAGWSVQVSPSMSEADVLALVSSEHVEAVGISISNADLLAPVTRLVAAVRSASLNPSLGVMLGGSLMLADKAAEIGATFCTDPLDAVRWLDQFVSEQSSDWRS
jgi:MerR family transcriptional regulator, light-induced transcriptional regulator